MNTAVARKRIATPTAASMGPAVTVQANAPSEILQVLLDWKKYPSPVRPIGSGSSTTRCITANGGTQLDLSAMNRVLKIEKDTVTVQPGISLPDLAEVLAEEGLELIGGFDLASRTVGGAVCAAGLEASMAGDVGQFASHAVQLKVLSPNGKRFVVSEKTKSLLALMRLSYGLLGVVYEITLRVRPIQGFAVQTAKVGFKDFGKLGNRLLSASAGVKLYLLPFRDRIYFELRRPAAEGDPGKKFAWRLKDWTVYSALPEAARSLGMALPIRQLRYPLDRQLERGRATAHEQYARAHGQQLRRAERPLPARCEGTVHVYDLGVPRERVREHRALLQVVLQGALRAHGLPLRHAGRELPAQPRPQRSAIAVVRRADVHDQPAVDSDRGVGRFRVRLRGVRGEPQGHAVLQSNAQRVGGARVAALRHAARVLQQSAARARSRRPHAEPVLRTYLPAASPAR